MRAETASLGTVVENEQVVQLPLNGRLFIMLAAIVPGVALPPNSVLPRINGGRPRTNEYLFDGISVLQPEPGQVAYYPIVDAIQEFKIESNSPPAEFGRFNGGVVNLTTKSGGNAFHGNVFEFFRNEHLNARNFFQRANPVKPQYRRNQYGGMLGGPVVKDRTFFFVDYQGQRQQHRPDSHLDGADACCSGKACSPSDAGACVIYDPATTVGNTRQPFPDNTIPRSAMDPVALVAPRALPAADLLRHREQLQPDRQRDQRSGSGRRAPRSQVRVRPGSGVWTPDPLPRSRRAGHRRFRTAAAPFQPAASPSDRRTRSRGRSPRIINTPSPTNLLNEVRDRRYAPRRRTNARRSCRRPAGAALNIPGIPTNGQFPNTMPTFAPNGYQQLGSPMNTASDFGTSVTRSPIRSPG